MHIAAIIMKEMKMCFIHTHKRFRHPAHTHAQITHTRAESARTHTQPRTHTRVAAHSHRRALGMQAVTAL